MIVRSMEEVENFSSFRISYLLKLYENTAKFKEEAMQHNGPAGKPA